MKRNKKVLPIILMSATTIIMSTGCSTNLSQTGADVAKASIVMEDVSYIQDDSNPINLRDEGLFDFPEGTEMCYGFIDSENLVLITTNKNHPALKNLLIYNVKTKESIEIDKGESVYLESISENKKKILFSNKDTYVYDIDTKISKKISNGDVPAVFFDKEGKYVINNAFEIIEVESGQVKSKVNGLDIYKAYPSHTFLLVGSNAIAKDKFYFAGSFNDRMGIYSLDIDKMDNKVKPVFLLPKVDDCFIYQMDLINNGESILFVSDYEEKPGIYIGNIKTKEVKKVASGYHDDERYVGINYSLSNDKTKLLIEACVNNNPKVNVYLAEIKKDSIISKKHLYTYGSLNESLAGSSWWLPDDSSFLINEKIEGEKWDFDNIRKYTLEDLEKVPE